MTRVAIIAALADELKPLVGGWDRERRAGVDLWRRREGEREWIGACAGIGAAAAARAFAAVERDGKVDLAVSAGWAGAAREEFVAGQAYHVCGIINARTGERIPTTVFPGNTGKACWLATSERVAGPAEKRRLAAAYGAGLVDMEAAEVARAAAGRGIPFYCVKGVSDGLADALPDFNRFISQQGQFASVRFGLFALRHPGEWPALIRLAKNSRSAARQIRNRLAEILPEAAIRL